MIFTVNIQIIYFLDNKDKKGLTKNAIFEKIFFRRLKITVN